jgi:hypothetical protein
MAYSVPHIAIIDWIVPVNALKEPHMRQQSIFAEDTGTNAESYPLKLLVPSPRLQAALFSSFCRSIAISLHGTEWLHISLTANRP